MKRIVLLISIIFLNISLFSQWVKTIETDVIKARVRAVTFDSTSIFKDDIKASGLDFSSTNDTLIGSHNGYLYKVIGSNIDTSTVAILATQNKFTKTQIFKGVNILTKTAGTSDSILVREGNVVKYRLASSIASTGFKWLVTGGGSGKIYTAVQAASAGDVVIVDAGAYTETQNCAKDGVRIHLMNGATVTNTTSAMFDITGFSSDFNITGDATFILTNELLKCTSTTTSNVYLEYSKASNTGAAISLISFPNTNEITGSLTINGKISSSSSGGSCINIVREDNMTYLNILGGTYSSTAGYGVFAYLASRSININCLSITTTHGSNPALNIQCTSLQCNSGTIQGTNALTLIGTSGDAVFNIFNITAEIVGAISLSSSPVAYNNTNFNFNGKIRSGSTAYTTFTINIANNYSAEGNVNIYSACNLVTFTSGGNNGGNVNIFGNCEDCQFNLSHAGVVYTINGNFKVNRTSSGARSLGTFTNGTLVNKGRMISMGSLNNTSTDDVWAFTINGTYVINKGEIVSQDHGYTSSTRSIIVLQSGKLFNSGLIENKTASATAVGIIVTGNSTFIHDGGRIITSGGACISNAASTLTIKNYNPYFTNIARSGAGTYTETITGGGTEIVDTDVTE